MVVPVAISSLKTEDFLLVYVSLRRLFLAQWEYAD